MYSADTTFCADFWHALNRIDNLKYLLIENTFRNHDPAGAQVSGHCTADLLAQGLHLLDARWSYSSCIWKPVTNGQPWPRS